MTEATLTNGHVTLSLSIGEANALLHLLSDYVHAQEDALNDGDEVELIDLYVALQGV
jgi:hypothetical protein